MADPVLHIARPHHDGVQCSERRRGIYVISEEQYDDAVGAGRRICKPCVKAWQRRLGGRGFLVHSRFEALPLPEAIFIDGREPLVGPFCVHCGNPSYMHGPGSRCRNHRIHPLLPLGDLPRPGSGFTEAVAR